MLNEKVIKNNLKTEVLKGCRVDEYYYNYERNALSKSGGMWYQQYGDIYISVEDTNMGQGIVATISKDDVEFSRSGITFNRPNKDFTIRTIPFTNVEDVAEFAKVVPLIGDGKLQCRLLTFKINNRIRSAKNDKEIHRISTSKLNVAVDKDAWVYFIILKDGSLPIIVVTDTRVGFLGVDDDIDDIDIKDYAFKHFEEGFFNSYYHPYNFEVREIKTYENAVYGEPGNDIFQQLDFSEEISEDGTEYTNSDGISVTIGKGVLALGEDKKIVKVGAKRIVKFNEYPIACYSDDYINIRNFLTYDHVVYEIGLDNIITDENKIEGVTENGNKCGSFGHFVSTLADDLGYIKYFDCKVKFGELTPFYYKISDPYNPDDKIYYAANNNTYEDQYPYHVDYIIAVKHKYIVEVFQKFKDSDTIMYYVYARDFSNEVSIILNPTPEILFNYNSLNYKSKRSRSVVPEDNGITNVSFCSHYLSLPQNEYGELTPMMRLNHRISIDLDGNIVRSTINLGEDTKLSYNAFGVPKDL